MRREHNIHNVAQHNIHIFLATFEYRKFTANKLIGLSRAEYQHPTVGKLNNILSEKRAIEFLAKISMPKLSEKM